MHFLHNVSEAFEDTFGTDEIKNQIAEALARRIDKAVKAKKLFEKYLRAKESYEKEHNKPYEKAEPLDDGVFRVTIVIPNFPEGSVTDVSVAVSLSNKCSYLSDALHACRWCCITH